MSITRNAYKRKGMSYLTKTYSYSQDGDFYEPRIGKMYKQYDRSYVYPRLRDEVYKRSNCNDLCVVRVATTIHDDDKYIVCVRTKTNSKLKTALLELGFKVTKVVE